MKPRLIVQENYKQLIFVVLAFLAMVLISSFFAAGIVEKYMATTAEGILSTAETLIESEFKEAEVTVLNTAFSVRNRLQAGGSPEGIGQYLIELTDWLKTPLGDTDFISLYGLFGGQFVDGSRWIPPEDYRPEERPWVVAAREHEGTVAFTVPYPDARDGTVIISASIALRGSDGNDYGVVSYDMVLDSISEYVKGLQFSKAGYGMLMGPDFVFIAHPDEFYLGRKMQELSEGHAAIVDNLQTGNTRISRVNLTNNQGVKVVALYKKMQNGWYIGIADPMESYYRDVNFMILVLSIVGAILMAILCYILIKLSMAKIRSDEKNKSKTSFLARMSHEIRTPMNSILGMSEIILRKNISGEIFEYISIIRQSGNTLLSIINDILDFSKIESGHVQLESKDYSFASLINDVVNVIRVRLVDKPLDFFVTADSNIPAVLQGDEARIRQILINLLNNAVKYTRQGHIALDAGMKRIGPHKLDIVFRISDTGIGIKAEDMKDLFNDFIRVDVDRNQGIEGTGLGLTIANNLCLAMEGGITVSSEYGKGSVFTATMVQAFSDDRRIAWVDNPESKKILVLEERPLHGGFLKSAMNNLALNPVYAPDLAAFNKELGEGDYAFAFVSSRYAMDCIPIWGKRGNSMQLIIMTELGEIAVYRETGSILMPIYSVVLANVLNGVVTKGYSSYDKEAYFTFPWSKILIVDDIPTNLRVAAELMAPYQMQIDTCQNGADAVQMVQDKRYDLIFMDHMMPGMDGIEAVSLIRKSNNADNYYQNLPIVMLTANAVFGQREIFLKNGVNDFLAKPIEVQKLNAILKRWIPESKRREANTTITASRADSEKVASMEIPGVQVSRGLANTGGTFAVYLDILAVFCRDSQERSGELQEAVEKKDYRSYTTLVHALKSAGRSIGAYDFGDSAAALEELGKAQDAVGIAEKTPQFLENLKTLTTTISEFIAQASAAARETPEEIDISALHFEALKEALVNMDIETVNKIMLEYSMMPLDSHTKDLVNKIKEDILLFEYDKAVEKIQGMFKEE
ncbi:hybrid sensory kinase [Treponema primitia ZAS-2]|uniref:histidine kinase n=1 Tax=Treponema primitia (strain ATCC BAA-887 / DSM 12427 / ZAS-2) TaxID=545694 RepID=F5YMV8_TREPZ|nr:response regulator [Treponema primitia]AEF86297.1 hybrid sensory kinase [Treponema primitia ZAS-2]